MGIISSESDQHHAILAGKFIFYELKNKNTGKYIYRKFEVPLHFYFCKQVCKPEKSLISPKLTQI